MGIVKASVAVAMGLFGSASLMASPVLPSVAKISFVPSAPVVGVRLGAGSRVGVARSGKGSSIAPAAVGIGVLAVLAGTAGIVAGTSDNGGGSTSP